MSRKNLIAGIDEAGRGCVIGSLFVGVALIEESKINDLLNLGVRDSKRLGHILKNPSKRDEFFDRLTGLIYFWKVAELPHSLIDLENINSLELEAIIELIASLPIEPLTIQIDAPCHKNSFFDFQKVIKSRIGYKTTDLVIEHKADQTYPAVMCASIIAKTYRERHVERYKKIFGDFGSGYPSDPVTGRYIRDLDDISDTIIRKRWKTVSKKRQKELFN